MQLDYKSVKRVKPQCRFKTPEEPHIKMLEAYQEYFKTKGLGMVQEQA